MGGPNQGNRDRAQKASIDHQQQPSKNLGAPGVEWYQPKNMYLLETVTTILSGELVETERSRHLSE